MPYLNKSAWRVLLDCFLRLRFIEFELHRTIRGEIKSVTRWTECHILKQWNIQTGTDEKSCRVIWFAAHRLMKRSGWQTPRPSEFRTEDYKYKMLGHVESVQKVCACKATQTQSILPKLNLKIEERREVNLSLVSIFEIKLSSTPAPTKLYLTELLSSYCDFSVFSLLFVNRISLLRMRSLYTVVREVYKLYWFLHDNEPQWLFVIVANSWVMCVFFFLSIVLPADLYLFEFCPYFHLDLFARIQTRQGKRYQHTKHGRCIRQKWTSKLSAPPQANIEK